MKRFAIVLLLLCFAFGTARATMRLDLNEDGKVNILDLVAFMSHLTGEKPIADAEEEYTTGTGIGDIDQYTFPQGGLIAQEELSDIMPLDSIRDLSVGTEMILRTVWRGTQPQDFVVKYLGINEEMNPKFSYIMLDASDPWLVKIRGVAYGMSGSPVIYNGKIVGALSMTYVKQANAPYYFWATAIEDMLDPPFAARELPLLSSAAPLEYQGMQLEPIGLSMVGSGFSPGIMQKFKERYPGFRMDFSGPSSGGPAGIAPAFIPGGPIAVSFITGDEAYYAGVGTATYFDGDKVYAFGHPMEQYGKTDLPIVAAEINGIVTWTRNPYKIGKVGNEILGSIYYDGFPCVTGELGRQPEMFETETVANMPSGELLSLHHKVAKVGVPDSDKYKFSSIALFGPLTIRADNDLGYSIRVRTTISFAERGIDEVDRSVVFADPNKGFLELISDGLDDYLDIGEMLSSQQYADPTPESVKVEVETVDSVLTALITDIEIDSVLAPGAQVVAKVRMIVARGQEREISVAIDLPADIPAGACRVITAPFGYFYNGSSLTGIEKIIDDINKGHMNTSFSVYLVDSAYNELSFNSEDLGMALQGKVSETIEIIVEE